MSVRLSRVTRIRRSMTRAEWTRLGGLYAIIAALHLVGFGVLILFVVPSNFKGLGIGVGLAAYGLGLRHAFDADHISAIDNTTRKLLADGKRPLGVGFFFSLGHSSVVVLLTLILTFAARAVAGQLGEGSSLSKVGGLVGTSVSAFFLFAIAAINLVILRGIVQIFREMRGGHYDEPTLEAKLNERGLMNRFLGPLARSIRSSWQMYPIGFLFGLGFDTATEVGLLALAAGSAVGGIPWYATMCLPVIFAAGMSLMDTTDGAFMNVAYGWAFSKPVRKVFYNLAITGLSVAVALIIGVIEVLSIVSAQLNLTGGIWNVVGASNLINIIGYVIVGLFVVTWLGAVAIWRFGHIEQKWALAPATAEGAAEVRLTAAARERIERDRIESEVA